MTIRKKTTQNKNSIKIFNEYINAIKNISFLVSGLLYIFSKFIEFFKKSSIFSAFFANNKSFFTKIINFIGNNNFAFVFIFLLCLISLFIKFIISCLKSRIMVYTVQKKLATFIHTQLVHDIRHKIVELENITKRLETYKNNGDMNAIENDFKIELENLKKSLTTYINSLSKFLSEYRNDTISVCIKLFLKRDRGRTDFMNERIITIARSENTKAIRDTDEITIVGKNTDFGNLCNGQSIFFGCCGLAEKESAGVYSNDSSNWKKRYYDSTLVAPIRYNAKDNNNSNNTVKPDILGFLCIDSKKEIKEWENQESFELQVLAIFADILYIYIKEFYECYEKIGFIK